MISASDRRRTIELIEEATSAGARKEQACRELGISARTYQRWTRDESMQEDRRPTCLRPVPQNKLSEEEQACVLEVCYRTEFASLPPGQIVPRLADDGIYIASESSFYRILRKHHAQHHRGRARPPRRSKPPESHCAQGPCSTWSWDITWLPGPAKGMFYYLYMVIDIYSRKIVGWEVYEKECSDHASELIRKTVLREGCLLQPLVLHADNGSPMKGATLLETLRQLGIEPSYSRPRVSNDNPYSEAAFRTFKYRPDYPADGFQEPEDAREWVAQFVRWYNTEHRHSAIRYVTPEQRHQRQDEELLRSRAAVYEAAREKHPERWTGKTRCWTPIREVWLNPTRERGDTAAQMNLLAA